MYMPLSEYHVSLHGQEFNDDSYGSKEAAVNVTSDLLRDGRSWAFDDYLKHEDLEPKSIKEFYVAQSHEFVPDVNVYQIIDEAKEQAWSLFNYYAEHYLEDVTDEAITELKDAMNKTFWAWARKHNKRFPIRSLLNAEKVEVKQ